MENTKTDCFATCLCLTWNGLPERFPGWQTWYAAANLVRDQIEWVRVFINAIKKIETKTFIFLKPLYILATIYQLGQGIKKLHRNGDRWKQSKLKTTCI